MNEEFLKRKYQNLYNGLKTIRNQLDSLKEYYDDVYVELKTNLLIDEEVPNKEMLQSVNRSVRQVYSELCNNIIPYVRTKR